MLVFDEDQARRADLALMGLPARSPPGDIRTTLFSWQNGFFEAQPLGMNKSPNRAHVRLVSQVRQVLASTGVA